MATPFPFTTGQVLTAAQMNSITELIINDKTDSYTLVAGDAGERVIMNKATATTITVPNNVFVAGQMVFIANKGAGTCTVTAGAGTTVNVSGSLALTQWGGGTLLALSASTFAFFPAGGVNTLNVDFLLVGGGGGGGYGVGGAQSSGGGGAGGFITGSGLIGKSTYTIKVAGGGLGSTSASAPGRNGSASGFLDAANGGGGGGSAGFGLNGASGGGMGVTGGSVGTGISGEGNNGGTASGTTAGGGGGGASGVGGNGSGTTGGAGGTASTNNYTGSSISYSGGGGGAGSVTGGTAGTNAGNGGGNAAGSNGTANRGGGGGGGYGANNGGNGGSGRVVVRWLTADGANFTITSTGSPTTGTDGSYTWYAWDSTGSLTLA